MTFWARYSEPGPESNTVGIKHNLPVLPTRLVCPPSLASRSSAHPLSLPPHAAVATVASLF